MDAVIHPGAALQGTLTVPSDKAICHRAMLAAAIAEGETVIHPWPDAEDCQRTLALIQELGVSVTRSGNTLRVIGAGRRGLRAPTQTLSCGESGTTLRLAAGLLAGQPFTTTLSAGATLSRRPMRRIVEPLTQMGAVLEGATSSQNATELYPPLVIHGQRPLHAIRYHMLMASAQVKSAILFAGLAADGVTTVIEQHQTRDHTERMLQAFGVSIQQQGHEVSVAPGDLRTPGELVIPGDFSSAAFFLVAAACVPGSQLVLHEVSLNPTRSRLIAMLQRMGAHITSHVTADAWEPRGTIEVRAATLRAITLTAEEVPGVIDELPILMVAAACARGRSVFQGLGELRVKETDRIQSMMDGLQRLGVRLRLTAPETLEIDGGPIQRGVVESAEDHRTAMSLAVAGLVAEGEVTVCSVESVAKSLPSFFSLVQHLTSPSTVKTVDND